MILASARETLATRIGFLDSIELGLVGYVLNRFTVDKTPGSLVLVEIDDNAGDGNQLGQHGEFLIRLTGLQLSLP